MKKSLHESLEIVSGAAVALGHDVDFLGDSLPDVALDSELLERFARIAAEAVPPSNNMGVPYPPTPLNFSHSEKSRPFVSQKTSIDWLGFSTLVEVEMILIGLQIVWPGLVISSSKAGMRGYPKCNALFLGEVQYGLIGHGAKHGRNSVSLTGVACKTIITDEQYATLHELLIVLDARLSRVDICFDFYKGEVTFDYVLVAFNRGDFKAPKANKNPDSKVIRTIGGGGDNLGRTLYIGIRDSEKYGRVYEKGLEVFAKLPEEYREASTEREAQITGDSPVTTIADDWLRLEVEFKYKNKDRPMPLNMLLERDLFFAGAYPFYAWALGMGEGKGRSRLKSDAQINHDKLIMAHRRSYGNHVHSLRRIGFTAEEICDLLDTGMHNQKLLKSGLVVIEQRAVTKFREDCAEDVDISF